MKDKEIIEKLIDNARKSNDMWALDEEDLLEKYLKKAIRLAQEDAFKSKGLLMETLELQDKEITQFEEKIRQLEVEIEDSQKRVRIAETAVKMRFKAFDNSNDQMKLLLLKNAEHLQKLESLRSENEKLKKSVETFADIILMLDKGGR